MNSGQPHNFNCIVKDLSKRLELQWTSACKGLPLIVGITGDGGLGKSVLAEAVVSMLDGAFVISTDSFLLERQERQLLGNISGDDPRAVNIEGLTDTVTRISNREGVINNKRYDHSTGRVLDDKDIVSREVKVLLIEGAFAMHPLLRPFLTYAIFLEATYQVRYALRMTVDVNERGYTHAEFEKNWPVYNELYQKYVAPNATAADFILHITCNRLFMPTHNERCTCQELYNA